RQTAFGETGVVVRLQPLQTNWRFEFTDAQFKAVEVPQFRPGIVDNRCALSEVRPDVIVDVLINGARKRGAHAAQQDRVGESCTAFAKWRPAIDLNIRADLQDEIAAVGADGEAARVGCDGGGVFRPGRRVFI